MEIARIIDIKSNKQTGTIDQGDKVLKKASLEYLNLTIEINTDEQFVKVYYKKMFELSRSLSGTEMQFVNYLMQYIRYESGLLAYDNGRPLTKKTISKELEKDIRTIERWFLTLINREVVKKVDDEFYINPFLFMRGKRISKTLFEIFKNSRWAK